MSNPRNTAVSFAYSLTATPRELAASAQAYATRILTADQLNVGDDASYDDHGTPRAAKILARTEHGYQISADLGGFTVTMTVPACEVQATQ